MGAVRPEPEARSIAEASEQPLTDGELEAVPVAPREDPAGLSRAAKRAYAGLRYFARGRVLAWPRTGKLAGWMGVSPDTARRAVDELLAKGYAERTGLRVGKAEQYRLLRPSPVGSPQNRVGSPQSAAPIEGNGGGPYGADPFPLRAAAEPAPADAGSAAADALASTQRRGVSPGTEADRAFIDGFLWTPELRADYAARARAVYERLCVGEPAELEAATPGVCSDCQQEGERGVLGLLELCRPCAGRRHAAAIALAAEAAT